jgi:hypothetical protein
MYGERTLQDTEAYADKIDLRPGLALDDRLLRCPLLALGSSRSIRPLTLLPHPTQHSTASMHPLSG